MAAQALNVEPIVEWLDEGAPPTQRPQDLLQQLCHRLLDVGIPLFRVAVFVRTLHPNVGGRGFIWHEASNTVEIVTAPVGIQDTEQYLKSPLKIVFTQHVEVRRRICDGCRLDFPILEELRDEGGTDFVALPVRFLSGEVHAASFATRRAEGFTEAEVGALRRIMPAFSRVAEIYAWRRTTQNILDAYLGGQAGEKVLAGRIHRGDGEDIHAVIWFCDLRDSTPIADSTAQCSSSPLWSVTASRATSAGSSTFGSRSPDRPAAPASAARSAAHSGPPHSFTRACTGTACPVAQNSATAARAYALRCGCTASSRSRMTASAPLPTALANRSGRSPGT